MQDGVRRLVESPPVADVLRAAAGHELRTDPVLPGTGGPAGNARLTAWTGLVLLPLFVAELVTLLGIRQLITWHLVLGVLLVPPSLLKTASTGWRIVQYYRGSRPYQQAGPPPLLLRLLGPLVVAGTLGVLASGLLLLVIGQDRTFSPWFTVVGFQVSPLTLHQALFVGWGVATGLHVLARTLTAWRLVTEGSTKAVPGTGLRLVTGVVTVVVAVAATWLVVVAADDWKHLPVERFEGLVVPR